MFLNLVSDHDGSNERQKLTMEMNMRIDTWNIQGISTKGILRTLRKQRKKEKAQR